ncbi:MAG: ATP-binding protein [Pseudomonadota bacterium]
MAAAGKIALNIAHEINNPLGGIITYTHLLQEDLAEGVGRDQLTDLAGKILKLAHRCQIIVGGLLDFARDERCDLVEVRINPIIGETLALLEGHLILRDILVFQELEPRLPPVLAVRRKMEQVFMNLIINAAEAMNGRGFLGLSTASDLKKGLVSIKISDTGPGISDETRRLLFEPFFSTKPQVKGAGLGLSIAHGIIRQHKGTIEVDSLPGQGTTFTITLPTAN